MVRDLSRLLQPKSIAVIGGGAWCEAVLQRCVDSGFQGPIWPVHPKRDEIAGLAVSASVADLPQAPDAVFIGVNRHATIELVQELRAMGAGGAVCFASGFAEADDGGSLNAELLDAAGDMPILGPNCYGFINALDGAMLWPDVHGCKPVESGVAIIGQSSNVMLNLTMQRRGLPMAYVLAAGNQAQTDMAEMGQALLEDGRVTALGLHIEGVSDVRGFEALAEKARNLGKPIVVLKVGKSSEARAATISHTASLAGEDAGAQALFNRLGIARAPSLSVFMEMLKIAHGLGDISGNRIASLSCSGGEASLMADAAKDASLTFPPLEDSQKTTLGEHLDKLVTLTNPLDYHTDIWRNREAMAKVFAAMAGAQMDLTILVLDYPRNDVCDDADWHITCDALKDAARQTKGPFAVLASLAENMPEAVAADLLAHGIVPLCGLDDALAAIGLLANRQISAQEPVLLAEPTTDLETLDEARAKTELAAQGLEVPRSLITETPADEAERFGFPLVLKGLGIAHKSEAQAVAVGLNSRPAVAGASAAIPADRFLMEEMVTGALVELLVGITHDPAHGFVLTLGAGGTQTELLRDKKSLLVPASEDDIETALMALKIAPLLKGFRGKPAADMNAIVKAVRAIQNYCIAHAGAVAEVEVNPLICTPDKAVAADALIVRRK